MKTNTSKLRLTIGISLEENTKRVDRDVVKKKFDKMVSDAAAGRSVEELDDAEIWELGEVSSHRAEDRVPEKTARLLGIPPKSSYHMAMMYCRGAFIKYRYPFGG